MAKVETFPARLARERRRQFVRENWWGLMVVVVLVANAPTGFYIARPCCSAVSVPMLAISSIEGSRRSPKVIVRAIRHRSSAYQQGPRR